MKKNYITSAIPVILGLLIAFGPHYIFKVCPSGCCANLCNYSAHAETGAGLIIAALGLCMMIYTDPKVRLGMVLGIFFAGIVSLLIPHALIGGCAGMAMNCRRVTFPILTFIGALVLVYSAFVAAVYLIPGKNKLGS